MERIGSNVRRELGRFGPATGMAELVAAWPEAVGESIARNAWPARLARDGTLHVAASSAAWAFELGLHEPTILERLRSALPLGAPRRLRFVPGPLPEPAPEPGREKVPGRAPVQPTAAQRRTGVELAAGIADEKLRELVARAVALSLARAGSSRTV